MAGGTRRVRGGPLALIAGGVGLLLAAATLAAPGAAHASSPSADSRYSLVHGCFALRSESTGGLLTKSDGGYAATAGGTGTAESFRMQATDLGSYLLYDRDREFLSAANGATSSADEPTPAAEWVAEGQESEFTLRAHEGGVLGVGDDRRLTTGAAGERFRFVKAGGCPQYPEVAVNARGRPAPGSPSYGEVSGLLDAHLHLMTFEFIGGRVHCGRPWHPYGAPYALQDCPDHAPNGSGAVIENLAQGDPGATHTPYGWPSFTGWPTHRTYTHEQAYYRWLERTWRAGLRLLVSVQTDNGVLCEVFPLRKNPCDEMANVRLQIQDAYELQDYVDAQAGGPGKGWFRIVRNPFRARRVINRGKLAVVLSIETSRLFGCDTYNEVPECDREQIRRQLDEVHAMGVRNLQVINKFDNALSGVAGDSGRSGVITNTGNKYETGQYLQMETCTGADSHVAHDHSQEVSTGAGRDDLLGAGLQAFLPAGTVPVYPEPPHCNRLGLSSLGEYLVRRMIRKKMIVDPDHMSVAGRNEALALIEAEDYSGVISSHSWSTPDSWSRIYRLGGVITPISKGYDNGGTRSFVSDSRRLRRVRSARHFFGMGFGSDINGFSSQPGGDATTPAPVDYPFRAIDGAVTLDRQRSGERTYDLNADGLAHYGLYPDWVEALRVHAGQRLYRDLSRGPEAYLQMWERAEGIEEVRCDQWRQRFLTARGLARRVELGDRPRRVLERAGQPVSRTRVWRWCAKNAEKGPGGKRTKSNVVAVFSKRGRVALVESTLAKHRAAGIRPGMPESELRGRARKLGGGLWIRDAGKRSRFVYGVRGGRISFVAVATRGATASTARLRNYLRLARAG